MISYKKDQRTMITNLKCQRINFKSRFRAHEKNIAQECLHSISVGLHIMLRLSKALEKKVPIKTLKKRKTVSLQVVKVTETLILTSVLKTLAKNLLKMFSKSRHTIQCN